MRRSPGRRCASCWWSKTDRAYCQPCLSPVWDTSLAGHALAEAGVADGCRLRLAGARCRSPMWSATGRCAGPACARAAGRSSTTTRTTPTWTTPPWSACCCTATAIPPMPRRSTARANGSSACSPRTAAGARSSRRTRIIYLNHIPFADHGALLDPPTADVSARCVSFLAQIGMLAVRSGAGARAGLSAAGAGGGRKLVRPLGHQLYLRHLVGAVRAERRRRCRRTIRRCVRAVDWLVSVQREDGGWGEDEESYGDAPHGRYKESTPSQTAWALLGLMAAGRGQIIRRRRAASPG